MIAAVIIFLSSCMKETNLPGEMTPEESISEKQQTGNTVGYVYTLSNQVSGNEVLVYARSSSGHLTPAGAYSSGGNGTGTGLGNQGAVVLSADYAWLLAVNPGSNTISSFRVAGDMLELVSTVSSGGMEPISLTIYGNYVYVLNAGGTGNISGFTLTASGMLQPINNSTRPLSSGASAPAQISFVNEGSSVVITEKATNLIISYSIDASGIPGMMHSLASAHPTPFGFAAGNHGYIYVSEAAGGMAAISSVSSYHISSTGVITLVDGPEMAGQTAACWVVLTNNDKYIYVTNTGSNNISSFSTDRAGGLSVVEATAAPSISMPIDAALSNNSKYLYVLNSGTDVITAYTVDNSGGLTSLQMIPGIPDGATGLAAK